MPLGWPTPVVCPSWSLSLAKPAGHTLSSINIFQTWPLYTDSYQIFQCLNEGCSSAVVINPPLPRPPLNLKKNLPPHPTSDYQIISLNIMKKKKDLKKKYLLSNCLSVLILYFNAAKFSIQLFYFIYLTVSFVSQRDKYKIVTETQPSKNT